MHLFESDFDAFCSWVDPNMGRDKKEALQAIWDFAVQAVLSRSVCLN